MRVTAFTCTFGKTDSLKTPLQVNPAVRYVCLSDQWHEVPPYECVLVPCDPDGARLLSRQVKILANHPSLHDPDVTLWHDAAYQLDCDPVEVAARTLTDRNMVAFRHPHRTQIEDEAVAIQRWGYVPFETMQRQIAAYRAEGFTQRSITSTGFCLRRMSDRIRAFNRRWWREVETWGWRDQMSVDYAMWRTGIQVTYITGHYRDNPYAKWHTS